MLRHEEAIIWH